MSSASSPGVQGRDAGFGTYRPRDWSSGDPVEGHLLELFRFFGGPGFVELGVAALEVGVLLGRKEK